MIYIKWGIIEDDQIIERYSKPNEAICVITYCNPQNVEEICLKLYGNKRNARVSGWITELLKKNWIRQIENFKDRRYKYYKATPKSLFDSIVIDLKKQHVILSKDKNREKRLLTFLDSDCFRKFVKNFSDAGAPDFTAVKKNLCYLVLYITFIDYYSIYRTAEDFSDFCKKKDILKCSKNFKSLDDGIRYLGDELCCILQNIDLQTSQILTSYFTNITQAVEFVNSQIQSNKSGKETKPN